MLSLENPSQPTSTEPTMLGLAEKILWSPPFEFHPPLVESPSANAATTSPSFVFPDEILSEARALTAYSFSHVAQMASIETHDSDLGAQNAKPHSQPIISLYYPHEGCHNIIDSMVKFLAHDQGADVVVLDSLELALQEFGAFGKGALYLRRILLNVVRHDCLTSLQSLRGPQMFYTMSKVITLEMTT
jgi:hypothetical protein